MLIVVVIVHYSVYRLIAFRCIQPHVSCSTLYYFICIVCFHPSASLTSVPVIVVRGISLNIVYRCFSHSVFHNDTSQKPSVSHDSWQIDSFTTITIVKPWLV